MHDELNMIKKKYGEKMMHLCRELFPTILEEKGLLYKLLSDNFAYSKFLYEDIIDNNLIETFKNYIYSFFEFEEIYNDVEKSVEELLDEAGYKFYECHSEEDIKAFKKYYKEGEQLCTFNGNRLDNCHVFFAVKKNIDEIMRKDYLEPKRQDNYGISVISIQFSKGKTNTLSIKNRYNHSVKNPDATFSNNLDSIKRGLTKAFEKQYNLNINYNKKGFEIPGYVKANDGKYYKYNYEINNIYYCPDNVIIDNFNVKKYDKSDQIVLDYFILNLRNKSITTYDKRINDSITKQFDNVKKIEIKVDKLNKKKKIYFDNNISIVLDNYNNIIEYKNSAVKTIDDNFMNHNVNLQVLSLPEVEEIRNNFLTENKKIQCINLEKLKTIGDNFLSFDKKVTDVSLPNVEVIGNNFLSKAEILSHIDIPKVETIGDGFLSANKKLNYINLPNVKIIGACFINCNSYIQEVCLPNVEVIGSNFLNANENLINIDFPNVRKIGNNFLLLNEIITSVNLPKVEIIGKFFLHFNENLTFIELPNLKKIDDSYLSFNTVLHERNLKTKIRK